MIACRNEPGPESFVFVTMNWPDEPESLSLIWSTAVGWKSIDVGRGRIGIGECEVHRPRTADDMGIKDLNRECLRADAGCKGQRSS